MLDAMRALSDSISVELNAFSSSDHPAQTSKSKHVNSSLDDVSPPPSLAKHGEFFEVHQTATLSANSQRERVESILRGFSSASAAHPLGASGNRSESKHRHSASTGSTSHSVPRSETSAAALLRASADSSKQLPCRPRGTVEQVLMVESQNEVCELRRALLRASDACTQSHLELNRERTLRAQMQDDLERAQRKIQAQEQNILFLESELRATQNTAKRDGEASKVFVDQLQKRIELQSVQMEQVNATLAEMNARLSDKEQDLEHALLRINTVREERDGLKVSLQELRNQHDDLMMFVDGPLSRFAKDANAMKTLFSSLEVSSSGSVKKGSRVPEPLEFHWNQKQMKSPRTSVQRKYVEKLFTDSAIKSQTSQLLERCSDTSSSSSSDASYQNMNSLLAMSRRTQQLVDDDEDL